MPIKDVIIELFKKYEDRNGSVIGMEGSLPPGLLCPLLSRNVRLGETTALK